MMMTQNEIDAILDLEPEELAIKLLGDISAHLKNSYSDIDSFSFANIYNVIDIRLPNNTQKDRQNKKDMYRAHMEAWTWLESNALIIWSDPHNGTNGHRVLSRRAEKMSAEDLQLFANAKGLSRNHLHAAIAHEVWSNFIRGQFDTAVFLAAKAVEVSVKEKSDLEGIGVSLMRKAFKPNNGPLCDKTLPTGEQEARMGLFAGFIGSYKNPGSHRDVNMEDPLDAIQVVLFASHLLKIIDLTEVD